MKPQKMRELTVAELEKKERDLREELFRLRFQHVTGQLENPIRLRLLRRELARVITIGKEREPERGAAPSSVTGKAD
jgi:large subunit ribosomal protein L29